MGHKLFELDVRLKYIEPPIWRTVEVAGSSTLEDVHLALQVAMGWENSHLHSFTIDKKSYGIANGEDELGLEDESEYQLQDLVKAGASFDYEYDFGDSWTHRITVKRVSEVAKPPSPRCTAGARACPPEDCGGPPGYERLLGVLSDPKHDEHAEMLEWAGPFDPERFAVPKKGLDLASRIEELQDLADDDDLEEDDTAGIAEELGLPVHVIETILDMDPVKRAALASVIATSLAHDLLDVMMVVEQVNAELERRGPQPAARTPRKRQR